ncbi:RNA polymerase sigma factor [Candidatus Epulonipiscium viviparus]|uniref:RNA polymerase sigma factor n=1 Tax=Candidatus Epulonipiscium viviparus TaxID=420336 RepID=UPI00016C0B7C|nr:RNA polymerase sigma factor [Candidatus Epulopiscium viviparus]
MDESSLIKRAQSGDVGAFEVLIKNYESTIYRICFKVLKNEADSFDAAQEVCIKIWKQLGKFEEKSKFSTWVYRIATNQCLDILRKGKNKKVVSINQNEEWALELEDTKINIEKQVEDAERLRILKSALDELKKEYSEIIILKDVKNLSYEEIATEKNISLGTVKSRLFRARNALKNILKQDKEPFRSFWRHNNRKEGL